MADDDHPFGLAEEVVLEPAGALDVEMVVRLVEQHDVGGREKKLRQHEPALLAAGKGVDRAIEVGRDETEALQDLLDPVVDGEGSGVVQHLLEPIEASRQRLAGAVVGRGRHRLGDLDELVLGGEEGSEGVLRLVEQRPAWFVGRLLAEERDAGAGVETDVAGVGPIEAGEDLHQRRLAAAVGADQTDALAGEKLEAEVVEEGVPFEASAQIRATQQKRGHLRDAVPGRFLPCFLAMGRSCGRHEASPPTACSVWFAMATALRGPVINASRTDQAPRRSDSDCLCIEADHCLANRWDSSFHPAPHPTECGLCRTKFNYPHSPA